ncbi:hypothetical protein KOR42_38280 [Thalassoglobus neptunius]|uniref:Uncharacterized protein n=1 Tax=Thalassoglobus neptunius TaxID=1938619 RepID=A0A5C5WGF4_9PLAN|nr:hypothetical protein KOR42_38280 [Thalassoglobus neptunius]
MFQFHETEIENERTPILAVLHLSFVRLKQILCEMAGKLRDSAQFVSSGLPCFV